LLFSSLERTINYHCPVEDCDFGHETPKSKQQVQSHLTNKSDESHDSDDLEPIEMGDSEPIEMGGSEPPSDGDGDGVSEPIQNVENDQYDQTDGGENMVSPEEYERQEASGESDGTESENDRSDGVDGDSAGRSVPLPNVPPMYSIAIIAGVFAAIVIWRVVRSRRSGSPAEPIESDDDDGPDGGSHGGSNGGSSEADVPLLEG